jgi:hypothetical protein
VKPDPDFVRPYDVMDPERYTIRPDEVDYEATGAPMRRFAFLLVCIFGVIVVASLLPQPRHADQPSAPAPGTVLNG